LERTKEAPTFGTKPRSLLRRPLRRPKPQAGIARVDLRTKRLVQRVLPGELVVIDHEDLDGVSAEALIHAEVGGVVNAARSDPAARGGHPADRHRRTAAPAEGARG
jgi:uncharacterized membrane-anchored protein